MYNEMNVARKKREEKEATPNRSLSEAHGRVFRILQQKEKILRIVVKGAGCPQRSKRKETKENWL